MKLYHEVCEAHVAHIVSIDLKSESFSCAIDEDAKARAQTMYGKLLW
ncbi:MAG: hypothetical protein IPH37_01810 [Burkholderiales bacterium]|nr:hypothetical protein [Burkholderiales bacterium]MBK9348339.1 hypothetical protein [Burkholderiales bacterium]